MFLHFKTFIEKYTTRKTMKWRIQPTLISKRQTGNNRQIAINSQNETTESQIKKQIQCYSSLTKNNGK